MTIGKIFAPWPGGNAKLCPQSTLITSDDGPIPPDARWITVHRNGPGSKGTPVLVMPAGEGDAMRVIGGADGKLNMLELRGVKSEAKYKASASANQAAKRAARKDQITKDKALVLHEAKEKARGELFEQTARPDDRLCRR